MTQQHPITPPPELVQQWCHDAEENHQPTVAYSLVTLLVTRAVQWGADQELEACCEALKNWNPRIPPNLYAARRPKPPNLKEQSIALLDRIQGGKETWDLFELKTIRRALEQLDD